MRATGRELARLVGACGVAAVVVFTAAHAAGQNTRGNSPGELPDLKARIAQCNTGDAKVCNFVGAIYATGLQGVKIDVVQAFTFFQKACTGGHATGCGNLANAYYNGLGVAADRARAIQLYQRACDLGGVPA